MVPINSRPRSANIKDPSRYLQIDGAGMVFDTDNGSFVALSTIDLDIAQGEFVSLIGHSGCGKSTVASLRSPEFRLKTRHAAEGDYDGLVATLAVSEEEQISVGQLAVLPGKIGVGPIAAPRHVRRHIERGESLSDGSRRKHSSGPLAIGRPQLRGEF